MLGNSLDWLHGHVHARYEWEPADRIGWPVWNYPPSEREDPAVAYSDEKHGALRSAITSQLGRLMSIRAAGGLEAEPAESLRFRPKVP